MQEEREGELKRKECKEREKDSMGLQEMINRLPDTTTDNKSDHCTEPTLRRIRISVISLVTVYLFATVDFALSIP